MTEKRSSVACGGNMLDKWLINKENDKVVKTVPEVKQQPVPDSSTTSPQKKSPIKSNTNNVFNECTNKIKITEEEEDWGEYDFSDLDNIATDKNCEQEKLTLSLDTWQRCEVTKIENNLLLLTSCADNNKQAKCYIQDEWLECIVKQGDIVSIRGEYNKNNGYWLVHGGNDHCRLIVHPDNLLSCTSLTLGLRCRRRAVFTEMFKGISTGAPGIDTGVMTLGNILHEITQTCLLNGHREHIQVREALTKILNNRKVLSQICNQGLTTDYMEKMAEPFINNIVKFLDNYLPSKKQNTPKQWDGVITEVLDVEDTLWVPQLGLRGKIDVLGKVKKNPLLPPQVMPLELKTRESADAVAHRAQSTLYSLLLSEAENNSEKIPGIVVYLKESSVHEYYVKSHEVRDGLIMRNELAYYINNKPEVVEINNEKILKPPVIPPVVNKPRDCSYCPYVEVCTAYLSKEEITDNLDERLPQLKLINDTEKYSQEHFDFFIKWTSLVLIENKSKNNISSLWTKTALEREGAGSRTLSNLTIKEVRKDDDEMDYLITFTRNENHNLLPINGSRLNAGDLITLGHDKRYVVSFGFIEDISNDSITIRMDRDITRHFGKIGYSIDGYQSNNTASPSLSSLAQLLSNCDESFQLRKLIIDGKPPGFSTFKDWNVVEILLENEFNYNEDQKLAIKKVFESENYVLIQGLPGTGKTATIVMLVRLLVRLGQSVLITSHTNSAVDNVLLRLLEHEKNIIRLGSRCHNELLPYFENNIFKDATDANFVQTTFESKNIAGITCTSAAQHWLLRRRTFDVCIVDEATQVPFPLNISPLLPAKRFVLVGDPQQLQPVIVNPVALEFGMGETLFERLAIKNPDAVTTLGLQYRLNSSLCDLANKVTYNGLLTCANENVANATLQINSCLPEAAKGKFPWLVPALSKEMDFSALFLDIGRPKAASKDLEATSSRESSIVKALVHFLVQGGISPKEIGIMTPFRAQAQYLSSQVGIKFDTSLEISTIDQFQGKDKTVAIISCVKSFPLSEELPTTKDGILNDHKRLTVAITRAKVKLLIVGDAQSLAIYKPFSKLLQNIGSQNILTLRLSNN